jgi:hypothetical protein
MKKMARLGLVLMLLALASPAFAGPGATLTPYCWDVNYTSCREPEVGLTISCTDGMWYDYTCTCTQTWNGDFRWYCSEVR